MIIIDLQEIHYIFNHRYVRSRIESGNGRLEALYKYFGIFDNNISEAYGIEFRILKRKVLCHQKLVHINI
jgi:hypothetical protein